MRRLTGLFAALLFVVAVSPAVASTSDSATNDYTATVNSDISITYDGSIAFNMPTPDNASSNSAVSTGSAGKLITLTIEPTTGGKAVVEASPYFNVSSNQSFGISVDPSVDNGTTGGSAIEFDDSGGAKTGVLIDNLAVRMDGSTVSSGSYVSLPSDNANHPATVVSGISGGEYTDIPVRYQLDTPDDLAPQDYNVTLTWTAEQGL